jgi:uncharacterized membrane protein
MSNRIHITLLTSTILWCLTILMAPFLNWAAIYQSFALICHQDPARSWHLHGAPLAVCMRCSSIYFGFLISLWIRTPLNTTWLTGSLVAGLGEFIFAQMVFDHELLRCLTGSAIGASAAPFIREGIEQLWSRPHVSV